MTAELFETLQTRARLYQEIRAFFRRLGHIEVDTPLLASSTSTDVHIQSIAATVNRQRQFLQTSPEFYMKRLLAAGSGSIFQICHAFRDEEEGRRHAPEFSLLEWYSVGIDYLALMDQVESLVRELSAGQVAALPESFVRRRYRDCFTEAVALDPLTADLKQARAAVQRYVPGIDANSLDLDDCLDLLISQVVAPRFDGFTFVYDFPPSQASLAKIRSRQQSPVAERFELYFNDLELANGFTELTDANEQRSRFEQDNDRRKKNGLQIYPLDEALLGALATGLPDCAGVALGLDRLLMVLLGCTDLRDLYGLGRGRPESSPGRH